VTTALDTAGLDGSQRIAAAINHANDRSAKRTDVCRVGRAIVPMVACFR